MTNEEYLKKIHEEILEIMDIIHEICVKNNLKYYLTGGTLLGAVRHQGFIPWDDDLDIAMPRDDFDRFFEVCKTWLPTNYVLEDMNINPELDILFAKVQKKDTLFLEKSSDGICHNLGIFVDIFPLDETNGNMKQLRVRKRIIHSVRGMIFDKIHHEHGKGMKRVVEKVLSIKMLRKILHGLIYMTNRRNELYYTGFASQYPVERKTQLKTVYGKGTPILFENRMYMAPEDYKTDLLSNFGPKYMELPPVEKRRNHYPVKVVFSDGSVFESTTNTNHVVSVEESINW